MLNPIDTFSELHPLKENNKLVTYNFNTTIDQFK